jgi:hypothetical protein
LIARRTHWVSKFIWYPSLVIAGMFAATFTVEYGQYRFESNPVTLLLSIGMIVAAVVLLRQAAETWRADVLRGLAHKRLALLAVLAPPQPEVWVPEAVPSRETAVTAPEVLPSSQGTIKPPAAEPPNKDAVAQLEALIDLVTQLHDGAFAPYSEQPLVRAVLLPAVTFAATAGLPFLNLGGG